MILTIANMPTSTPLQNTTKTASDMVQRGVEYGKQKNYLLCPGIRQCTLAVRRHHHHSYEEFTRLAETRLAQNIINYLSIDQTTFK